MRTIKNILLFALIAMSIQGCKTENERPNILFILSDDHTSQAWGIYGGILEDYVHTPSISKLADEGCVLDNCLVSNSICVPSRATILTGQYSHINGVKNLWNRLMPEQDNIAKHLQTGGYQTALIGKWHLKEKPSGFDHYCVLPGQGVYWNPVMKTEENWAEGGISYEGFSTDVIADMTINWIEQRDKTKPFYAMCHFKATHEPFDYPERHKNLNADIDLPMPTSLFDTGEETTGRVFKGQSIDNLKKRYLKASADSANWRGHQRYPDLPLVLDGLNDHDARVKTYQKFVKDFIRCGAAIDDNIGKLLDYLEEAGLDENTVVIYTADQGYFLGEHGWFDKRMIYEESAHMPFVIRYPKEIKAGSRNNNLIENVDFSALFADYANITYPETMQGVSFRENLKGKTPNDWRDYSYYRYWEHSPDRPGHFGIRGNQYKLAFYYGNGLADKEGIVPENKGFWEFFDLSNDPDEFHNGYGNPKYAEIIAKMKREILRQRDVLGDSDQDNPEILRIIEKHWTD